MPDGDAHAHVGGRDPERDEIVHGLVRDHFATFAALTYAGGRTLPRYVVTEFESFLRDGVLAFGFMRARCPGCGHDRLVAFSCKHRGESALGRPPTGAQRTSPSRSNGGSARQPDATRAAWGKGRGRALRFAPGEAIDGARTNHGDTQGALISVRGLFWRGLYAMTSPLMVYSYNCTIQYRVDRYRYLCTCGRPGERTAARHAHWRDRGGRSPGASVRTLGDRKRHECVPQTPSRHVGRRTALSRRLCVDSTSIGGRRSGARIGGRCRTQPVCLRCVPRDMCPVTAGTPIDAGPGSGPSRDGCRRPTAGGS